MKDDTVRRHSRTLLIAGAGLFLVGMFSGLLVGAMANPRMGLSAHLVAGSGGVLLIALGATWHRLSLAPLWRGAAFALVLYANIANWLTVQLAAFWGGGRMMPLAANGMTGADWQEAVIGFGLVSLSLATIASFAIIMIGFWRGE